MGKTKMAAAFVLCSALAAGCTTVPPGHVGVKTTFGAVNHAEMAEGFHLRAPWTRVTKLSTQAQAHTFGATSDDADAAVTSDMQTVGFRVNVGWYLDPSMASEMLQNVNRDPASWVVTVIDPGVRQAVKSVFSEYTLRDLTQQREVVRAEIAGAVSALIAERLNERSDGLGAAIVIQQVTLDNLDYSEAFEAVIEATQQEEQRARLAENQMRTAEIEAQRQVVEAQAERTAAVERARGEAEALSIRNAAQVEAYRDLAAVGVDVNLMQVLDTWDGTMPRVVTGEPMSLIIDSAEATEAR